MKKKLLLTFILFSLIIVSLPITATAANYKTAYRKVVNKFEKERSSKFDKRLYDLIYIDKDKRPELICVAIILIPNTNNVWFYYREFYTFHSGRAMCFFEAWNNPLSLHSSIPFYQPKHNVFGFRCWDQGSISDAFRSIKKGRSDKIDRTVEYGRTGDINKPPLDSKYKWIEAKYSKKEILKKLR